MGFLNSGESKEQKQSDALENQQIQQNQAELEAKKQNLYETRLDIIKGQGGQSWTPNYGSPLSPGKAPPFMGNPGGIIGREIKKATDQIK